MIKPHCSIWKWTEKIYNFNLIIKACSFCHFNGNHGLQKTLDIVNILYSYCLLLYFPFLVHSMLEQLKHTTCISKKRKQKKFLVMSVQWIYSHTEVNLFIILLIYQASDILSIKLKVNQMDKKIMYIVILFTLLACLRQNFENERKIERIFIRTSYINKLAEMPVVGLKKCLTWK